MRESLKPVEPGCLAVVVGSLNCRELGGSSPYATKAYGTVITVLGDADCECCVSVDRFRDVLGHGNGLPVKIRPENLIRIDPDEDQRRRWGAADKLQAIADQRGGRLSKAYRELERKIREMDR